jgi:LysM repeat protein
MAKNRITDDLIIAIYNENLPTKEIAKKYNVSVATVRRIKNLEYKKYKDVIEKYKQEKTSKSIDTEDNKNNTKTTLTSAEQLLPKELTIDDFVNVLFVVLNKYIQPEVSKFLIDNYVVNEKTIELTKGLVNKINEVKTVKFYKEALAMLTNILLRKCFSDETYFKLFGEKNEQGKTISENK